MAQDGRLDLLQIGAVSDQEAPQTTQLIDGLVPVEIRESRRDFQPTSALAFSAAGISPSSVRNGPGGRPLSVQRLEMARWLQAYRTANRDSSGRRNKLRDVR